MFYNYCLDRPDAGGVRQRFLPHSLRAGGLNALTGVSAEPTVAGNKASRPGDRRHD
ncbi:hypothetical protein [Sodalis praecaptivus]|uniref:hypothetical protein n=1 Tax=Sodalis praecaptivus TaxID=1239307 RepID=UPI0031F81517